MIKKKSEADNILQDLRRLDKSVHKLEAVKQNLGADIIDVVTSSLFDQSYNIAANDKATINILTDVSDDILHLIHNLWSIEIYQRGETILNIDYNIPLLTDAQEIDAAGGTDIAIPPPLWRSIVESTEGILVAFYTDLSGPTLYATASYDGGLTWSVPTTVTTLAPHNAGLGTHYYYDVFIDSNNHIHVVYTRAENNVTTYYRKLTYSAGSWSIGSENEVKRDIALYPSVAVTSTGRIYITYTFSYVQAEDDGFGGTIFRTRYEFRSQYSDNDGVNFGNEGNLGDTNSTLKFGRIVMRGTDRHFIWYDHYFREVHHNINGGGRATAWTQTNSLIGNWTITVDDSNRIHVITKEFNASSGAVEFKHRIYNGINWGSPGNIADGTESDFSYDFSVTHHEDAIYLIKTEANRKTQKIKTYTTAWGSSSTLQTTASNISRINSCFNMRTDGFVYAIYNLNDSGGDPDALSIVRRRQNVADSLEIKIEETADDGTETNDTTWDATIVKIGEHPSTATVEDAALRFNDITIPQGATITAASLSLIGNENSASETVSALVKGIKEANAAALSSSARPSTRSKTTANVAWSITDRSINVVSTSPDIKTIIQEIVNQPAWVSGNSLILVIEDNGNSNKDAAFVDYQEQAIDSWYNLLGSSIKLQYWKDWASSDDSVGLRSAYFIIENLTSEQITARLRTKAYAIWQSSI